MFTAAKRTVTVQHVIVGTIAGVASGYYIFEPILRETMDKHNIPYSERVAERLAAQGLHPGAHKDDANSSSSAAPQPTVSPPSQREPSEKKQDV